MRVARPTLLVLVVAFAFAFALLLGHERARRDAESWVEIELQFADDNDAQECQVMCRV